MSISAYEMQLAVERQARLVRLGASVSRPVVPRELVERKPVVVLKKSSTFVWSDDKVGLLVKRWDEGVSNEDIANELGCASPGAVRSKAARLKLPARSPPKRQRPKAVYIETPTFDTWPHIKIQDIQRAVCEAYRISRIDLISQRRTAEIVRPRQIAMWLCKRLTVRSLPEIGMNFGGRDHTTVLHAVRKIESMVLVGWADDAEKLRKSLNGEQA